MRFFALPWVRGVLFAAAAGLVLAGALLGDVQEVVMNASILCLSCIGIK